ncbi:MAG: ATP-binding protein [Anaerolineales bacterium]
MTLRDWLPQGDHRVDWLLWGLRWFWLVLAGLLLAGSGGRSQVAVAAYVLVQVGLSVDLLRPAGPSQGATMYAVLLDVLAPAVMLASVGFPVGPAWAVQLAGAASLGAVAGMSIGWAGGWVGLLLAAIGLGMAGGSLAAGLALTGLHAVILLPATLAIAWCTARLARTTAHRERSVGMAPILRPTWTGREPLPIDDILDSDQLLQRLLSLALDALHATGLEGNDLTGAAFAGQPGQWRIAAGDLERGSTSADGGLMDEAVKSGRPEISQAPDSDPGLSIWAAEHGWSSAVCLPLVEGETCHGAILFGHQRPDAFGPAQLEVLAALGQEARITLHYAHLFRDLTSERDQLTDLQEEARKKLARNLHDGPTQVIAAIAMRTNFARRQLFIDVQAADEELGKVEAMARDTTREIRHMLFTLRPLILESQGLVAALHQYAHKVEETHHLAVEVEADEDIEGALDPEQQGSLFYITEEAVNNAQKHAAAATVSVRLLRHGNVVLLEVEDNGVGFNVGEVDRTYEQRGSLGMVTMRERAQLLGGIFEVGSEEGIGTTIRVSVPVQ